jgi:hypothetical protein
LVSKLDGKRLTDLDLDGVMLKINLEETVYEDVGWTHVAQNTVQ